MQQLPQWVCWRYELIGNQQKKPPYDPRTARKTDVTKETRWGTYKQALTACHAGRYDGIGFVFLPSDPYTGIDLDHCIDPDTGEIAPWARKILDAISSYTEYSPGGDGLHILTRAQLPDRGLKEGNIEVYSHGVYFTFTGNHVPGTPMDIEDQQERVNLLHEWLWLKRSVRSVEEHTWGGRTGSPPVITWQQDSSCTNEEQRAHDQADAWILHKARNARNGATFARLYDTIIPDHDGGQSVGDLQLCVQLLYWCRDEHSVPDLTWADRLFRKSARMRGKWDRRLGAYTYGQVTLWKAYIEIEHRFGRTWKGGRS